MNEVPHMSDTRLSSFLSQAAQGCVWKLGNTNTVLGPKAGSKTLACKPLQAASGRVSLPPSPHDG